MTKNKFIIISLAVLVVVIILLFIRQNYLRNNVDYQMRMLTSGTTEQRLLAADILGEKKIKTAIPILISNVTNLNSSTYARSRKSPETISCTCTFALENITGIKLGNTCNIDGKKTEMDITKTQVSWQNWYKNDYLKWSQENQN